MRRAAIFSICPLDTPLNASPRRSFQFLSRLNPGETPPHFFSRNDSPSDRKSFFSKILNSHISNRLRSGTESADLGPSSGMDESGKKARAVECCEVKGSAGMGHRGGFSG
jgi:hypothetical protein